MSDATTPYIVVPLNRLRGEPEPICIELEKKFIRDNIIGKSNHEIVHNPDPEVMVEMRLLGSDLNINVFACNFHVRSLAGPDQWKINDDVEEANYLNKCIFDRMSVTNADDDPLTRPMYLTSTILAAEGYGECLTTFKRRLGLETESVQSLFVLRNVVMSPFQATADFAEQIAQTFRSTLMEEMEVWDSVDTYPDNPDDEWLFSACRGAEYYISARTNVHYAGNRRTLFGIPATLS